MIFLDFERIHISSKITLCNSLKTAFISIIFIQGHKCVGEFL
jgi:hypothetical protein